MKSVFLNKKKLIIAVIIFFLLLISFFIFIYYSFATICILLNLAGFTLICIEAYFPRVCPTCKIKMKRHFGAAVITPDYYYCENCRERIDVKLGDVDP